MREIDGYCWPEGDRHAADVVFSESANVDLAVRYVRGLACCVQAGGHCGVWANRLARSFTVVWTIEPDLENYLCMARNLVPNVQPIWAALGDKPGGGVGLERRPENSGAHFINGEGRIGVITIDELELEACDLIVLDIEGMEPLALHGAKETIERFKPVLMVEDKGLSDRYGFPVGWSDCWPGYGVEKRVKRDVILVHA